MWFRIGKVKAWLDRTGKSPREQVEKNRLKYFADAVNAATATTALPDGCRKSPGGSAMKEEFVAVGLVGNTPNFPCSVSEPRNI